MAEVQSLFQDGSASLHTRSLKYGKLRNGYLVRVAARAVQRSSRTQVFTVPTANGGGEVDVVVGVNGYIWISKRVAATTTTAAGGDEAAGGGDGTGTGNGTATAAAAVVTGSITRLEEEASEAIYSNTNDYIPPATRREIARIGSCIKALVRHNLRVDEDMLNAAYEAAVDEADEIAVGGGAGGGDESLDDSELGRRVLEKALARKR